MDKTILDFITLDEIKKFLHIDYNEYDELIKISVLAAIEQIETYIGNNIIKKHYQIVSNDGQYEFLLKTPVIAIDEITVDNNLLQSSQYRVEGNKIIIRAQQKDSKIIIKYIAGLFKDEISPTIKMVILMLTSYFFENDSKYTLTSILSKLNFMRMPKI